MIRKRIQNKIKNFELLKRKDRKRLANIGVISLLLLSLASGFLSISNAVVQEVEEDEFDGSNWNVTGDVTHNASGGYIAVQSIYGQSLKDGNAWWYPDFHSNFPMTYITLKVNYTGEIDQTGSNVASNEIFINVTVQNETGSASSTQTMVHRTDFDATYNETFTWDIVDMYDHRYVNVSFYIGANGTTDNVGYVAVRWLELTVNTDVEEDFEYINDWNITRHLFGQCDCNRPDRYIIYPKRYICG